MPKYEEQKSEMRKNGDKQSESIGALICSGPLNKWIEHL